MANFTTILPSQKLDTSLNSPNSFPGLVESFTNKITWSLGTASLNVGVSVDNLHHNAI